MSLEFHCRSCNHRLAVPQEYAGRTGKCAKCGAVNRVPAPITSSPREDGILFDCPHCGRSLMVNPEAIGQETRCIGCRHTPIVPSTAAVESALRELARSFRELSSGRVSVKLDGFHLTHERDENIAGVVCCVTIVAFLVIGVILGPLLLPLGRWINAIIGGAIGYIVYSIARKHDAGNDAGNTAAENTIVVCVIIVGGLLGATVLPVANWWSPIQGGIVVPMLVLILGGVALQQLMIWWTKPFRIACHDAILSLGDNRGSYYLLMHRMLSPNTDIDMALSFCAVTVGDKTLLKAIRTNIMCVFWCLTVSYASRASGFRNSKTRKHLLSRAERLAESLWRRMRRGEITPDGPYELRNTVLRKLAQEDMLARKRVRETAGTVAGHISPQQRAFGMDETRWTGIGLFFAGLLICAWQIFEVTSGDSFTLWMVGGFIPLPVILLGALLLLGGVVAFVGGNKLK